jgi:hypothetical protein
MSSSRFHRALRGATAPVRDYINNHFEMVKHEVRTNAPATNVTIDETAAWLRMAELENTLAELSLHEGRILNRVGDELEQLAARIDDLEHVVERLATVVGAMTVERP